ncbi:histidine-phosphotransfer domain, HPT domain-containing protein [Schizophyllum commune H4-8]|nr:histidine-phosphotransfer domain, HPT domain-containing protein [Schizophyllum commune H4-8]KAI5896439.1 histidine-phosphotransfer domain, HPT domain-containing protein [Schizophyllum commune H4-8]
MDTFQQLLDLDEDETHDFSRGMVDEYFSQAETTFEDMDKALKSSDLPKLSSLGHFLKGSSATLGVSRVQLSCQKIQHYGEKKNEGKDLSDDEALSRIGELLGKVKVDFRTAEEWLQAWYRENAVED